MTAEAAPAAAHPQHGARQQLLGAVVALLFPHPDQRGHKRLIHRLGDQVDQQAGNQRGGKESIHGVGAAIDPGDGNLLEGGDELDRMPAALTDTAARKMRRLTLAALNSRTN